MKNLPVKYQPRVGDQVSNDRSLLNRGAIGTVVEADHQGVIVRWSETRLSVYPLSHHLEVVSN